MQVSIFSIFFFAGNFPKEIYDFISRDRITRTKYDRKPKLLAKSITLSLLKYETMKKKFLFYRETIANRAR